MISGIVSISDGRDVWAVRSVMTSDEFRGLIAVNSIWNCSFRTAVSDILPFCSK